MSGSPEAAEVDDGSSLPALLAACEASRLALGDIELTLARLGLNVTAAVARTGEDFAILSSALSDVAVEFKREVLRLHRHRLQWLDKHCEELTAVEGVLLAGAGMSDAGLSDLSVVAESVASILPLSTSTVLSQHSLMSMPPSMEEPQALLAKVGSVSDGSMNSFTFTSSGVDFCEPGNVASSNTLTVECRYKDGGCVRGLQAEDFDVSITAVPDGVPVGSVCSVSLSDSTLTVEYSVPLEFAGQSVRITVDLFNCTIWDNVVKVSV